MRVGVPREGVDATALDLLLQLVAGAYSAPGAALVHDLASGAFTSAVDELARVLGLTTVPLAAPPLAALQSSHVDLFVSSPRGIAAPPYVGYAVDGVLLGPTATSLSAWYDAAGITVSPDWHDLVDHVAAVAEAGTLLLAAGRPDAASVLVREYLGPWFERYAAAVEAADDSGFYGPLTRFLANAVMEVERATRA